jgi:hypothetical protein
MSSGLSNNERTQTLALNTLYLRLNFLSRLYNAQYGPTYSSPGYMFSCVSINVYSGDNNAIKVSVNTIYHSTGAYIPTEKMTIGHATVKLLKV